MKNYLVSLLLAAFLTGTAQAADSSENSQQLITVESAYSVSETIDRLEEALKEKGMTIFARVNHAEGAEKVDMQLRATELLIFGNPKVGTPLMQCDQTIGIELPQKALAWEDEAGATWLAYNDPEQMAVFYQLDDCQDVLKKVTQALGNFAKAATRKDE